LRVTLKGVRSHRLRFLLTAVAVMLGVSLVAGTYVLTDSMHDTFNNIVTQGTSGLDVSVRGVATNTSTMDNQPLRVRLPIALGDRFKSVPGVTRVSPDIQGSAVLVGSKGTAIRNGGAPTLALAFAKDDRALKLVNGRGPQTRGEVAVESSTLKLAGLKVGDQTKALIGGKPETVKIVGQVSFNTSLAGATMVLVDAKTARAEFAPDNTVPSFSLTAAAGVSPEQLVQRVKPVLPPNAEAVTSQQVGKETKQQIDNILGYISTFLLVFAGVSLFVGGFIIANTFSMLVAQRTRELALLRALGASRGQVLRVVLGEALFLGVFGSLLGLGVGILLASGLKALLNSIGLDIQGGLPVHVRTVVVSLLVGTVVTALSAILPAIRAARLPPIAAMRDDVATPAGGVLRRGLIGGALVAVGAAILVPAVTQTKVAWGFVALGAALIVIGSLVAAPATTRPVIRVVASPFLLLAGTIGRLARENALRNPRRTATTASALMVGLALMAAVSVLASSTKASVSGIVESQLTADYVLNGGSAPFPSTVGNAVAKLPEVGSIAEIGGVNVAENKKTLSGISADTRGIAENVKLKVTSGSLAQLDSGKVLISNKVADDRGWRVGTRVNAAVGTLINQPLTIGGVFDDSQVLGGPQLIVPRALYLRAVPPALQGDFIVYVKAKPGANLATLRDQLNAEVKPFLVVSVQDGSEFTDSQAAQVNQLLYVIYALLALSVLIAVLGIINTLALSVIERTRELGLLRAVGLQRKQLKRMIRVESIVIAVFGALLGLVVGVAFGWALVSALHDAGITDFAIPWARIVEVLVIAALGGVLAAALPARRAAKLKVLDAIATD
jgi:putative ABC transport system permease protein